MPFGKYLKTVSLGMTQTLKNLITHGTFDQSHIHDHIVAQKGRSVHTKISTWTLSWSSQTLIMAQRDCVCVCVYAHSCVVCVFLCLCVYVHVYVLCVVCVCMCTYVPDNWRAGDKMLRGQGKYRGSWEVKMIQIHYSYMEFPKIKKFKLYF